MIKNSDNEISKAFLGSSFAKDPKHGNRLLITQDYDLFNQTMLLNDLFNKINSTNEILFHGGIYVGSDINGTEIRCAQHGKYLLKVLKAKIPKKINSSLTNHQLNPSIRLILKHLKESNLEEMVDFYLYENDIGHYNCFAERGIEILNNFVNIIRGEGRSEGFKKTVNNYYRLSRKNYKSLVEYIDVLFQRYSRLDVLRMDLSYLENTYIAMLDRSDEYLKQKYYEAKTDREHFFKNMRSNKLFENLVGYAWKLEYAPKKGYHYHMLFFFDGSKVREDIIIGKMIGEYWANIITNGRGLYFNCNAIKNEYKDCGIGMISHFNVLSIENLKKAAMYLTKTDYYIRLLSPDNGRTFGRGEMPEPKTDNRGRPRKRAIHESVSSWQDNRSISH